MVTNMMPAADGFDRAVISETSTIAEANQSVMSFHELYAVIRRSRFIILGILLSCQLIVVGYSLLGTRYYESSVSIEVKQEAEKVLGTEADRESAASKLDADRFLQTQLDIIRSTATANAVAEKLGLYRNMNFLDMMRVSRTSTTIGALTVQEAFRDRVLRALRRNLKASYSGDTRLAVITFSSPDPRLSARVANAYGEAYIQGNLNRKLARSAYALDFLRRELVQAKDRLEQSEQRVVRRARETRIIDASNAAGSEGTTELAQRPQSLVTAQLVQANAELSTARAQRVAAEAKWRETAKLPLMSIPEVLGNQAIQEMAQRRAELQTAYQEQLANRRSDHPSVIQAKAGISEINDQIATLASSIKQSIRNQYDVSRTREREVEGSLDALKSATLIEQGQGIELLILQRDAQTNRTQYEALLKRFNELNAEAGLQANNLAVVDQAQPARIPSWPRLPLNLVVGLIAGLALSGIAVFLREQIFDAIRTPGDFTGRLSLAYLGGIPNVESVLSDMGDQKTIVGEAVGSLRTNLMLSSDHGAPQTLLFTSVQPGEGKTTTSCAVAMAFARIGKKVLVIDADLRHPNAHQILGARNTVGLSALLSGQSDAIDEVIKPTDVPNLSMITAGDIPPNPADLFSGRAFSALLDELIKKFDVIVVDSAPVLGLADAVLLSRSVEAVVFVVQSGRNSVRSVRSAVDRIKVGKPNIVGGVLTKIEVNDMGYGYGLRYEDVYGYRGSSAEAGEQRRAKT